MTLQSSVMQTIQDLVLNILAYLGNRTILDQRESVCPALRKQNGRRRNKNPRMTSRWRPIHRRGG
jgi:hypothetical protein